MLRPQSIVVMRVFDEKLISLQAMNTPSFIMKYMIEQLNVF